MNSLRFQFLDLYSDVLLQTNHPSPQFSVLPIHVDDQAVSKRLEMIEELLVGFEAFGIKRPNHAVKIRRIQGVAVRILKT